MGQGPQVILVIKGIEVQFLLCLALPQAQGADILCAITNDGHIVGNCQDGMVRELHLDGVVIPAVGPGVTEFCPVVSHLSLAAALIEALLKQAKAIPQTVAGQGDIHGRGRIQEAGSKTA